MSDKFKLRQDSSFKWEGSVMLGPVDLEAWLDEDEEMDLSARLRSSPEIQLLYRDASLASFPGWSRFDFALARRFCRTGYLDLHELHQLAEILGV